MNFLEKGFFRKSLPKTAFSKSVLGFCTLFQKVSRGIHMNFEQRIFRRCNLI